MNNNTGGQTINACIKCPQDMYQPSTGQSTCISCGASSTAEPGSAQCTCKGGYRAFQPGDGSCRCIPGYIFYADGQRLSSEDSDLPCQPKVFIRCNQGQPRSSDGTCVEPNDAGVCDVCPNKQGTVDPQVGICLCDQIQTSIEVCDNRCLKESPRLFLDTTTDEIVRYDPVTGRETREPMDTKAVQGKPTCAKGRAACEAKMIKMGPNGTQGVFNPSIDIFAQGSTSSSRRQSTSSSSSTSNSSAKTIQNPVVCLNYGDSMVFDISDPSRTHFPVYLKDNLLNTNPDFDYTAFRTLADNIKSPNLTLSVFIFTFTDPGVYVFGDNANERQITIIRVAKPNEVCNSHYEPVTEGSLVGVGVKRDSDILLAPDWILIGTLLGGLVLLVGGTIGGLWHFRRQTWGMVGTALPRYRNLGMSALTSGQFNSLASKGTQIRKAQMLATGEEQVNVPIGSSKAMTLRLDIPLKEFKPADFCKIIADEAGIEPSNVLILSLTEGSTVVRFVITGLADSQAAANLLVNRISDSSNDIHGQLPILAYEEETDEQQKNHPAFALAAMEDEFWDYERQIDLEGFNVRTLYDKLEDQTIHLVSQLANQRDDVMLLCDKILVEAETLKDMFLKVKLDIDDRHKKDKELQEMRDAKLSSGQVEFDLPEDLKQVIANFLENFFQKNAGMFANTVAQNAGPISFQAAQQQPGAGLGGTTSDASGFSRTTSTVMRQEQPTKAAPPAASTGTDDERPSTAFMLELDKVEGFKDMNLEASVRRPMTAATDTEESEDGSARGGRKKSKSHRGKRHLNAADFPAEILDDSDLEEEERNRRSAARDQFLLRRLRRARRVADNITMPPGLEDRAPVEGVTTAEEAAKLGRKREEWKNQRRGERTEVDQIPPALRDDPTKPAEERRKIQIKRQIYLANKVRQLKDGIKAFEIPPTLQDAANLPNDEREARRQKRIHFLRQKMEKLRKIRADTMVPLELADDSELDEETRAQRRDEAADVAANALIKAPMAPELPSAEEKGIPRSHEQNRLAALDNMVIHRAHIAKDGLEELDVPDNLSDRSDVDPAEADRRRRERIEQGEARTSGTPTKTASVARIARRLGTKAKAGVLGETSTPVTIQRQDFNQLEQELAKQREMPTDFKDDSDLDDEERENRRDLRRAFKAGRDSSTGMDTLPEDENAPGISAEEKAHRQALNNAFKRGRQARLAGATKAADNSKVAAQVVKQVAELQKDAEAKKYVELGKAKEQAAAMPDDYNGESEEKKRLQQAFVIGKKAVSVAAPPPELADEPELGKDERKERQQLREVFQAGKKDSSSKVDIPAELEDSAGLGEAERLRREKLRRAFAAGRVAQQSGTVPAEIDEIVTDKTRALEMKVAFEKGIAAARAASVPEELKSDPELKAAFMAGVEGEPLSAEASRNPKAAAAHAKGTQARKAEEIPAELRDDIPLLSDEEINRRRTLQALFKQGMRAQAATEELQEMVEDSTVTEAKELKKMFEKGAKAQSKADSIPEQLLDDPNASAAEREHIAKQRAAFIAGRHARARQEAIMEELPMEELSPAEKKAVENGQKAQESLSVVPEELKDDPNLSKSERARRQKLRAALNVGRQALGAEAIPEELVAAETERLAQTEKKKKASRAGVSFGGEVAVEAPETPAGAGSPQAPSAAPSDADLTPEGQKALMRMRKEHHQAYKQMKEKQKQEHSIIMEELETEAITLSKNLDAELNDHFQGERKKLQERHENELANALPAKIDELKRKQVKEMQELHASQEADRAVAQENLVQRMNDKKAKLKAILESKALNELRMQKTLQTNQEAEIRKIHAEGQANADKAGVIREEDLKKQKDALLEKLKLRERRLKAKANKEKEILEAQLRAQEELERDTLELGLKAKQEMLRKRTLALHKNSDPKELEVALSKVDKQIRDEFEMEQVRSKAKLASERMARETELSERHAEEKAEELRLAQEEVDKLLEAKRQAQMATESDAPPEISKSAQIAANLLVRQQQARKALQENLAKQREAEASAIAADDMKAKQEAEAKIKQMEKERGKALTEAQKKEIVDECLRNAKQMESLLTDEQKRQNEEVKRKLEERRRKKEAELNKKQLSDMLSELKRQEEEQKKKEHELASKIQVKPVVAQLSPEILQEEEELEKRNQRREEDLKKKHQEEQAMLEAKLKEELEKQQAKEIQRIRAEHKAKLMETLSQQTARESMQMTDEQKAMLMKTHEEESKKLNEQLAQDEAKQKEKLQAQLEARRRKKQRDLQERQIQEEQALKEKQEKDKAEFLRQAKMEQEKKVIDEHVARTGKKDDIQDVAQVVMAERHRTEIQDLARRQQQRRGQAADDLDRRFKAEREELVARCKAEGVDPSVSQERLLALEAEQRDIASANTDAMEMQFAEEQLQLKLGQWNEVSAAAGLAAPEAALEKYKARLAKRQVDESEAELLAFRQAKEKEEQGLQEKLAKEKVEYEKKMQEEFERRRREQEEELARKEKEMMEELQKEKERKQKKLKEARMTLASGDTTGPTKEEQQQIQAKLLAESKADEKRLRENLEREKEKQRLELENILKLKREKKKRAANSTEETPAQPASNASLQDTLNTVTAAPPPPAPAAPTITVDPSSPQTPAPAPAPAFVMTTAVPGSVPASPEALSQWTQQIMTQLQHSPLMEKVTRIEKMVAGQVRHGMLSYYIDVKDRQIRACEGRLEVVELADLTTPQFVVYTFAMSVRENISRSGISLPQVKIAVAKALPDTVANASAFRNSYHYDHSRRTLYIRQTRMANIGEFVLIMMHGLAHIKACQNENRTNFAGWNDGDPSFLTEFYGLLEACTEEMFYMRLPSSQAQRDIKEERPYRADSVMSQKSLTQLEEQLRTIGKQNRESFLKTYLMM
jgi:hypothetical protein